MGEIQWKRVERRKLGKKAIELTQTRLANLNAMENLRKYPAATIEDALDHEEDRTHYPIPNWYPPDAIINLPKNRRISRIMHENYLLILHPKFIKQ